MSLAILKKTYVNILSSLLLQNDKYWLHRKLIHKLSIFSVLKKLKFDNGELVYEDRYMGYHSKDKKTVLIDNEEILQKIDKNNYDTFKKDFVDLAQMTYFIFCYLFTPCNPEEHYKERWDVFLKKSSHDKISAFGKSSRLAIDLLISLNNNIIPYEFCNTLENCRKVPPIYSKYGVVFDSHGNEFKLLHYTVRKPNIKSHVSLILLEKDDKKYYKLSNSNGFEYAELVRKNNHSDCLFFDFNEFKEYLHVSDFLGDFSMLVIKGIYPEYNEDFLPMQQDKIILDMLVY